MKDPRFEQLADVLVRHSVRVQPGDKVLVEATDVPEEFLCVLIARIAQAEGIPLIETKHSKVMRALQLHATEEHLQVIADVEKYRMEKVQCYIGVRGTHNSAQMSDVPMEKVEMVQRLWWKPVHSELRVPKTRWVVLRWPNDSMAQQANMSTEAFEDYYFRVCTLDYGRMEQAVQPLVDLMSRTNQVRIVAPGTDLRFSIKDIPVIPCYGLRNIPDGECFTAPVRDSVEGEITFNVPSLYHGKTFENIRLVFRQGKIVDASAGKMTEELNQVLDFDEGARYAGEFSLGFNPHILHPMKDGLFDEKIAGSLHFTPGNAYEMADNGNRSQIHWDLVLIQRAEYGGGEIFFDGRLVRKDGLFVIPELEGLNPDKLVSPVD